MTVLKNLAVNKDIKIKGKFCRQLFSCYFEIFDVLPISLSPQFKPCVIITYRHSIYELPHELLNDSRLRILGN